MNDPKQLVERMDQLMLQVMIVRYRMTQDKLLLAGLLDRYAELEKMWREEIRKLAEGE